MQVDGVLDPSPRRADATEIARAEEALDLITARGFHRGRDLHEALAAARR